LLHPPHRVLAPPALTSDDTPAAAAHAAAVATAIASAFRLLDLFRQLQAPSGAGKQIRLLARRLDRIRSVFEKTQPQG
jgi:hypothetical protein